MTPYFDVVVTHRGKPLTLRVREVVEEFDCSCFGTMAKDWSRLTIGIRRLKGWVVGPLPDDLHICDDYRIDDPPRFAGYLRVRCLGETPRVLSNGTYQIQWPAEPVNYRGMLAPTPEKDGEGPYPYDPELPSPDFVRGKTTALNQQPKSPETTTGVGYVSDLDGRGDPHHAVEPDRA